MKFGLQSIDLSKGAKILIPDYICDVLLHPLEQLDIRYQYYSVMDDLAPNWMELNEKVTKETKAIMMVHYFGNPQDISAFRSFCIKHKLLLIEDNAHGHSGKVNGQLLGTFGDIGISSPRKSLNSFSGGLLWLKNKNTVFTSDYPPYPVSIYQYVKQNFLNPRPSLKTLIKITLNKCPPFKDPRAFKEQVILDYAIDKHSKDMIEQTNWDELRNSRQLAYHKWEDFALKNDLSPVFKDLSPDINPWCFPAYAKNQMEAFKWFVWGWKNGINIFPWPTLPEEVIIKNGSALARWRQMICFSADFTPTKNSCR